MGSIRKIYENELVGSTGENELYPVTSTLAVYDTDNVQLDVTLSGINVTAGTGDFSIIQKATESDPQNTATGENSVALGIECAATNLGAVAIGNNAEAKNVSEVALGKFNKSTDTGSTAAKTAFTVGVGSNASHRKNAIEVKQNGQVYINGVGGFNGSNAETVGIMPLGSAVITPINTFAVEVANDVPTLETTITASDVISQAVSRIYLETADVSNEDKYVYSISKVTGDFDDTESIQFEFQWNGFGYGVSGFHTRILTLEIDEETGYLTITRYRGLREGGTVMFDYPTTEG